MGSFMSVPTANRWCTRLMSAASVVQVQDSRGRFSIGGLTAIERHPLPDDQIGTTRLSLSGVHAGSEVVVFDKNGAVLSSIPSVTGIPIFTLPRYYAGSPNNIVRIMVLALAYEVFDFDYTLAGPDASIPVFQRIDRSYHNPA